MSSDDDNALKDVDLSAWDVPAPETSADELADSVIARVGGTDIGAAIPVDAPAGGRRRALLIAGVAAAVLAVVAGGWAIVKGTRHVAPSSGEVVAQQAQSLELDAARADLDTGADVKWSRRGGVLRVEQTGNAAWRVGTDSKLVVDVGPGQGISTGAALASVEATGASLRVEVTPMNAADAKIAGVVASTAAAVALVTVVVYEGHVKVRDGTTQQTVIVQPGTTYKVMPPPPPIDIVDDRSSDDDMPVVGVAPVGADEPPEVTIVAGDDVVIHDMSPPSRVKIDMTKACHGKADLVVNGVTTPGDTLAFNRGSVKYDVMCDDQAVANGNVTVVRDSLAKPLSPTPAVNAITADGRTYRVSFQAMPALEVHGGPGTLHMAHGTVEKTYVAKGESVLVPSADLQAGDYRYWFTPDVMSQLTLSLDTYAPIIWLDAITWGAQIPLEGATLPGSTLSVEGISIPVDGSGRFKAMLPGGGDTIVMRLEHPSAGLHYVVARSTTATTNPPNPVTVTTQSGTLDRGAIQKVMGSLKGKFASCVQANPPTVHSIIKVKVLVQADGRVGNVDVTQGVQAALDQCVKVAVESTVFPTASQSTAFLYPIVVEPPATPASCNADALKDMGMENVNMGQHAAALLQFEASLRCKNDPYVLQLAFMEACNARNESKARAYYAKLSGSQQTKFQAICTRNHIDPTGPTTSSAASPPACDADAAKDKGLENVNMGQHAAALAQFEASLRCKDDAYVHALAFMAACSAQDAPKAKLHFSKMSQPQRAKYRQFCVRNHIDLADDANDTAVVAPPAHCDADALKDKGMENVNMGQHAAALGNFEASLACKEDPYVRSLAFMAACNAQNAPKARQHYAKLSATQRDKYKMMCVRNHIDPETGGSVDIDDPFADTSAKGYLQLSSKPAAKIIIDGVDSGLTTPVTGKKLPLTAGKHKVTFLIGDDRFTYPVVIQAGKTATMSKDLR